MLIVRKIVNAKKRLPKKSGKYLTRTEYGEWYVLEYSARHKAFNVYDTSPDDDMAITVKYWAKLPKLPVIEWR